MLWSTHLAQALSAMLKASSPSISTIFPFLSRWSHLHPDVWGKLLGNIRADVVRDGVDLRPELAGVSPPVPSVEDENICTQRPLQHGRQLVQLERPGPVDLCFELDEERTPEELHGAIVVLFL